MEIKQNKQDFEIKSSFVVPIAEGMSALPPKADIAEGDGHVRFVPKADIPRCGKNALFDQLISAPAQIERHGNAKGLRSLEVDD
jgi:hypothetical protein